MIQLVMDTLGAVATPFATPKQSISATIKVVRIGTPLVILSGYRFKRLPTDDAAKEH
jgi:hypothetical protein